MSPVHADAQSQTNLKRVVRTSAYIKNGRDVRAFTLIVPLHSQTSNLADRNMRRNHGRGKPKSTSDVDTLLFDILSGVAAILVSTGYGYSRVNELAKIAFVQAALAAGTEHGKRVSIARIAALTGLTRTDVSKLVRSLRDNRPPLGKPTSRVVRVANGWATDKRFVLADTRPRDLELAGSGNSFAALVRKYSGDIPPKAMLTEMTRLGLVRIGKRGQVVLVRSEVSHSRRTTDALKAAIPWISFLASASTAQVQADLTSHFKKFELKFSSLPQVFAAMHELRSRHNAFVKALEQLGHQVHGEGGYAINLSVAVAATNPRIKTSRASSVRSSKGAKTNNETSR